MSKNIKLSSFCVYLVFLLFMLLIMQVNYVYSENITYLVEEDFENYELGERTEDFGSWLIRGADGVSGKVSIEEEGNNKFIELFNDGTAYLELGRTFEEASGLIEISFRVQIKDGGDQEGTAPSYGIANILFANDKIKANDGEVMKEINDINKEQWQDVVMLLNTELKKYDITVDGIEEIHYSFRYQSSQISTFKVLIQNEEARLYLDDLKIRDKTLNTIAVEGEEVIVFHGQSKIVDFKGQLNDGSQVELDNVDISIEQDNQNILSISNNEITGNDLGTATINVTGDYYGFTASGIINVKVKELEQVKNLEIEPDFNKLNLTWENPTSDNWDNIIVVRNINDYPQSLNDGTVIYHGTGNEVEDNVLKAYYAIYTESQGFYSQPVKDLGFIDDLNPANDMGLLRLQAGDGGTYSTLYTVQNWRDTLYTSNELILGRGKSGRFSDLWLHYPDLLKELSRINNVNLLRAMLVMEVNESNLTEEQVYGIKAYQIIDPDGKGTPIYSQEEGYRLGLNFNFRDHRLGRNIPWNEDKDNILGLLEEEKAVDNLEFLADIFINEEISTIKFDVTEAVRNWLTGVPNQGLFLTTSPDWLLDETLSFYGIDTDQQDNIPYLDIIYSTENIEIPEPVEVLPYDSEDTAITLKWQYPDNADRVRILAKEGIVPFGPYDGRKVYEGDATEVDDEDLEKGKSYYYAFFAYEAGEEGIYSNKSWLKAIPGLEPVGDPDLDEIDIEAISGSEIEFTWPDNLTNTSAYIIERRLAETEGDWEQVAKVSYPPLVYVDRDLEPNTSYEYRLTAIGQGESNPIETDPITTLDQFIAVRDLQWRVISASHLELTWQIPENSTVDEIQVFVNGEYDYPIVLSPDSESYYITGLRTGVDYRFRVVTVIEDNQEIYAETEDIKTTSDFIDDLISF